MAYAYQQNMFDGASYGYVKYNISPDLGTVVSPGTTITITGQAYFKNRANKSVEVSTTAGPDVGIVRRLGQQPGGQCSAQLHALVRRKR